MKTFLVGGAVRDRLMGLESKDLDYTAVVSGTDSVDEAYQFMVDTLRAQGAEIFLETPEMVTVRARFAGRKLGVDVVLARAEGPYSDNRHPDWVRPGALYDDQARRDFTVNSVAMSETGEYHDPFEGRADIKARVLRAVGAAEDRLREDPLRAVRAIRFQITKGFTMDAELTKAVRSTLSWGMDSVSTDRIREEVARMLKHSTWDAVRALAMHWPTLLDVIDERGIWFEPTTKKR